MKILRPAVLLTAFFVLLTGLAFPGVIWAIGRVGFPDQAGGSLVRDARGQVVGSALLGQAFTQPGYFHPRPSAAGNGYDAANSSGTNLGPTSDKLINGVKDDPATKDVDESFAGIGELARAYREELRGEVRVLVEKAIVAYEETLAAARRAGVESAVVPRTQAALERMRAALGEQP